VRRQRDAKGLDTLAGGTPVRMYRQTISLYRDNFIIQGEIRIHQVKEIKITFPLQYAMCNLLGLSQRESSRNSPLRRSLIGLAHAHAREGPDLHASERGLCEIPIYRCPFRPPAPALARARHGPVNFVPGLVRHYSPSCRAVLAHGLRRRPKSGPTGMFRAEPTRKS
jgi:hypothetical protein